jgi:hypothetical protein
MPEAPFGMCFRWVLLRCSVVASASCFGELSVGRLQQVPLVERLSRSPTFTAVPLSLHTPALLPLLGAHRVRQLVKC